MKRNKLFGTLKTAVAVGCVTSLASMAYAQSFEEKFDYSFYPYKNGFATIDGVSAGLTIDTSNADQYKHALDPVTWQFVKDGDYTVDVAEPMDFILSDGYINASKANSNVGFDESGNLTNYVNGRPFPFKPSAEDPQAGLKLIWNFQYGRVWGDLGCMEPWYWEYKSFDADYEKPERVLEFDRACMYRKAFRTTTEPIPEVTPNPDQVYRGIYLRVAAPFDLKDTQLLLHKYKDDSKRTNGWLYLGFQRRVRRLATGQVTDAFLGADIMIEDLEGYNGRVSDYDWEYLGEETLLMSMWNHNAIPVKGTKYSYEGYEYTDFTGKGECFPKAPWMARKVYKVKGTPKDPSHPLSHRIIYFDAQSNDTPVSLIYDRKGDLWKWFNIGWPHPDHLLPINKGSGAMLGDTASFIDVQAGHCTTAHFRARTGDIASDTEFAVQNLRASAN